VFGQLSVLLAFMASINICGKINLNVNGIGRENEFDQQSVNTQAIDLGIALCVCVIARVISLSADILWLAPDCMDMISLTNICGKT